MEITPKQLKQLIDAHTPPLIIDVRDETEWEIGHIAQARNIPLRKLEELARLMPKGADIVVHCRTGVRATKAKHTLEALGFTSVRNLTGGLVAWVRDIDAGIRV